MMDNQAIGASLAYMRRYFRITQDELASRLGVSRQAVSKWETGEAVPELNKVVLLAKVFGVTTDALLLDENEEEAPAEEKSEPAPAYTTYNVHSSNWVESVPGVIGKLLRRYGWLSGVYMALSGAGFTAIGALARGISNSMVNSFDSSVTSMLGGFAGQTVYINGEIINPGSHMSVPNPVATLGGAIIAVGVVMMIGGVALAVVLRKKSRE